VSTIDLHPSQRLQPFMRYGVGTAHSKRTVSVVAKIDDVVGNTDRCVVAHLNCCHAFVNIMLAAKPCPTHLQISLARFLRRSPSRLLTNYSRRVTHSMHVRTLGAGVPAWFGSAKIVTARGKCWCSLDLLSSCRLAGTTMFGTKISGLSAVLASLGDEMLSLGGY
jgi:hypothetical protein